MRKSNRNRRGGVPDRYAAGCSDSEGRQIAKAVNDFRRYQLGRGHALRPDPRLSAAAHEYALALAVTGGQPGTYQAGDRPVDRAARHGYRQGMVGEIAQLIPGAAIGPASAVASLLDGGATRRDLAMVEARHLGVACVVDPKTGNQARVLILGSPAR